MPTLTRLPIRQEILKYAFAIYAVLSLISMATMSIGAAILTITLIFTSPQPLQFFQELKDLAGNKSTRDYLLISLLLTATCAVSLVFGYFFPLTYSQGGVKVEFIKDMAKSWYLFWPWVILLGLNRIKNQDRFFVLYSWITGFGILSLLGIFQYFYGWPRFQFIPGQEGRYHATLFLGHHLSVASIFIFPFFSSLDLFQTQKKFQVKFLVALSSGFGIFTLFFTFSRALWIALPIGLLLWILWALPKKFRQLTWIIFPFIFLSLSQLPFIQKRIHDGIGTMERKDLWLANLEFFKARPLTGVGWHHNQSLSGYFLMDKYHVQNVFSGHAHNNFLDMLGGTGLFGALSWITWCLFVFHLAWKTAQSSFKSNNSIPLFAKAAVCAWVVFHINGLTQVNFWEAKVQHQISWIVAWSLFWNQRERALRS